MTVSSTRLTDRLVAALLLLAGPALAQAVCEQPVGSFVSITGSVDLQSSGETGWTSANLDSRLCEGDTIRVGERSRAAVSLINDAVLRIDQNSAMRLIDITPREEETSLLDFFSGAFQSFSRKPKFLKVNTPYLNGSVEGTEFAVRVGDEATSITVFEGVVVAANAQGEVAVRPGEAAQAGKGQAPQRRTVVRPRDQVQWALYYPPILSTAGLADAPPALGEAANCAANGNTACAFAALDKVPAAQRDAGYLLLRATVLLAVGRVDEARAEIDRALNQDAQAGAAHALRAVIGVAQNEREAALADGRRAVELDPGSAAAKIALSYALQANLELAAARDLLQQAVEQSPDDALAWARLAELHLAEGDRKAATAAAERAVQLQPGLSRTQNVLGFSALAEIKTAQAQAAFEQAIALDSADPLPHLGLGLAQIRQGMLEEGRKGIEAAVALDANNALLRAYLGKAYFEEKRGPLDDQQFRIAKELDPLDPTAYFYNAIRLQTENRPVEALRELEASIERNDNRAVYRSRLLLDQDRAARGTSQARVYSDLQFDQLAIREASKSLESDPSNASAHRFLSDAYRDSAGRREIARVSELLQAQLLQDVNINPVQPSVSATNLNIVTSGGPANSGLNEYNHLFERNRVQLGIAAHVGSNDTEAGEAVLSGIYGPASGSLGIFDYSTDGYRENNAIDHNIWDVYGQWAVTPALNIQMEYLDRETTYGDLRQNFDLSDFDPTYRRTLDAKIWRFGGRLSPNHQSDLLVSYVHSDLDRTGQTVPFDIPGFITVTEDQAQSDESDQYEAQYIFRADNFNAVVGGSYAESEIDGGFTASTLITLPFPPFVIEDVQTIPADSKTKDKRAYAYGNIDLGETIKATLGASYQRYDEDLISDGIENKFNRWNPKLGITWSPTDDVAIRAAYFKTVKPVLVSNRTLEPTQVVGFNQFFDDPDATRATRYGVGADWRPVKSLRVGGELTKRDVEAPVIDFAALEADYEDRDEWTHKLYAYWSPADHWSLSGELVYDKFRNDKNSIIADVVPDKVVTWTIPVRANYFHSSGWFAGVGVTLVSQEVRRDAGQSSLGQGDNDFTLTDITMGYRMPRRLGILSLSVQNLFDQDFQYQDDSYRAFSNEPYVSPYIPERVVMGRLMLSF